MAKDRSPKVVDGVHFIWVENYKGALWKEHWICISHPRSVFVFEPNDGEEEWRVELFKVNDFPSFPVFSRVGEEEYSGTEKIAWMKAAEWARRPVG